MVTLETPLRDFLDLSKFRMEAIPDDCPSFEWVLDRFAPDAPFGDALARLPQSPHRLEAAIFTFRYLLLDIDRTVRERFAAIIVTSPSRVVRRIAWERLEAATRLGAPPVSDTERALFAQADAEEEMR